MIYKSILLFFLLAYTTVIFAQNNSEQADSAKVAGKSKKKKKDSTPRKGKVYFTPLPAIAYNPTTGFLYGVAASTSMFLGDPIDTRMSTSLGSLTYSTKKQLMFTFKSYVYTSGDKWILLGDWRVFDSSQPTYGLGTGPESAKLTSKGIEYDEGMFSEPIPERQMMKFKYIRFHETALKKSAEDFYMGIGYHLDYHFGIDDELLKLPDTITSHYAYSVANGFDPEKYLLSGLSLNFIYDSRDNAANPYDGRYAFIAYRYNPEFLGSSKSSSSLWVEYRDYFHVSKKRKRNLIALWTYGNFQTSGVLPYMDLPALGWDQFGRSGRGYTQGRFRGQNLVYAELEYRFFIAGFNFNPDFLGGVLFVNATTASNSYSDIKLFEYIDPAFGIGLRIMVQKSSRVNLAVDYAWGMYGSNGFFFNINETF